MPVEGIRRCAKESIAKFMIVSALRPLQCTLFDEVNIIAHLFEAAIARREVVVESFLKLN